MQVGGRPDLGGMKQAFSAKVMTHVDSHFTHEYTFLPWSFLILKSSVLEFHSELKQLSRFLANIVVQVSRENEEMDWYIVLVVDPSADLKTMKIHYEQLAKQIREVGSEVYKLLDKAWKTLSNKIIGKDYDLRKGHENCKRIPWL
ncbi:hypothetical protein AgCh_000130 [Apium graveolens]